MVGDPLATHQSEQANRISDEVIRQSVEHQQTIQANAEQRWKKAHEALVQVVRHLDADYFDACQKSGHAIVDFEDEALHMWIVARIKSLQNRLLQSTRPDNTLALQNNLTEALGKIEVLQQEEKNLRRIIQELRSDNQQLSIHLNAIQQVQRTITPTPETQAGSIQDSKLEDAPKTTSEPDWMQDWRSGRTFSKESTAIITMGETGKCLRPSLIELLAKKLNLTLPNGSLSETFTRLINFDNGGGLVEVLNVFQHDGASTGGNHPDLLRLTQRGRDAFQYLTGNQARENEYDRLVPKHKSPEHTVLNIQASEVLIETGDYEVLEQAPDIHLPDGSVFIPDLVARYRKTGETIFIEVERDTGKNQGVRPIKWKNVLNATNGNIYVICDNISCQRAIQKEINEVLEDSRFNSHLTNINSLRDKKRARGGGIWLSIKRTQ
jgi:hypothetical protein